MKNIRKLLVSLSAIAFIATQQACSQTSHFQPKQEVIDVETAQAFLEAYKVYFNEYTETFVQKPKNSISTQSINPAINPEDPNDRSIDFTGIQTYNTNVCEDYNAVYLPIPCLYWGGEDAQKEAREVWDLRLEKSKYLSNNKKYWNDLKTKISKGEKLSFDETTQFLNGYNFLNNNNTVKCIADLKGLEKKMSNSENMPLNTTPNDNYISLCDDDDIDDDDIKDLNFECRGCRTRSESVQAYDVSNSIDDFCLPDNRLLCNKCFSKSISICSNDKCSRYISSELNKINNGCCSKKCLDAKNPNKKTSRDQQFNNSIVVIKKQKQESEPFAQFAGYTKKFITKQEEILKDLKKNCSNNCLEKTIEDIQRQIILRNKFYEDHVAYFNAIRFKIEIYIKELKESGIESPQLSQNFEQYAKNIKELEGNSQTLKFRYEDLKKVMGQILKAIEL